MIKGGLIGIIIILILSMILTPIICDSIRAENSSVSCGWYNNLDILSRVYLNIYSIPLIALAFLSGALIGRTVHLVKSRFETDRKYLAKKIEAKKPSPWIWESRR